ncbi:MAG: hypothetical protein WBF04_08410 [Candidatus Sulfotelmatobacter sp.]
MGKVYFHIMLLLLILTRSFAQTTNEASLQKILSNPNVWGKDFSTALADVLVLQKVGEHELKVEPNSIVGFKPLSPDNPGKAIADLQQALSTVSRYSEHVSLLLGCGEGAAKGPCTARVNSGGQTVKTTRESGQSTFVSSAPRKQFLAPTATVETLRKEFGPPERISQEVIQTEYERQPVIVTKYHYAGDAVVFATTNMKPNGQLDHADVNADAVAQVLSARENRKEPQK